jgi:hypothetical protein
MINTNVFYTQYIHVNELHNILQDINLFIVFSWHNKLKRLGI